MRRGFMLTAIATILFMLLIDTTFQYSNTSSSYSKRVSDIIVSQKVDYAFDDIIDGITNITGVSITQQQADLIFRDSFPDSGITGKLDRYERFLRSYYLTPDLEVKFFDPNDNVINLNQLSSEIDVQPLSMTYRYDNFSKTNFSIQIPYSQSNQIFEVWYNISVTNTTMNFTNATWNKSGAVGCVQGATGCIRFNLKVNDTTGGVYTAPDTVFDLSGTTDHLYINSTDRSCWIDIWLGNLSGQSYLFNMQVSNCKVETGFQFTFTTSDFFLSFPTRLKVRDLNYNTSKEDYIPPILNKLMK